MFSPCFPNNFPNIKTYMGYSFFNDIGKIGNTFCTPYKGRHTYMYPLVCVSLSLYVCIKKKSQFSQHAPKTYMGYSFLCWENALGTLFLAFPIPNISPLKRKLGLLFKRHRVKLSQPNVIAICTQSIDMLYNSICFSVCTQ